MENLYTQKSDQENWESPAVIMKKKESYQQVINKLWITFRMCIKRELSGIKGTICVENGRKAELAQILFEK